MCILGKQTSLNSLEVILFSISTLPGEGVQSGDYREEEEGKKRGRERGRKERKEDMQVGRGKKAMERNLRPRIDHLYHHDNIV